MKIWIAVAIVLIGLSFLLLPISLDGATGHFNTITGLYWCADRNACLHEIGHRMDWQAGWISGTPAFQEAVAKYKGSGYPREVPDYELYAALYAISDGDPQNLPPDLRPFFNWGIPH